MYTWTDENGKTHYSNNPGQVPADVWQEKSSPDVPFGTGPSRVRIQYRRYRLPHAASDAVRKLLRERNTEQAAFAFGPYLLMISGSHERQPTPNLDSDWWKLRCDLHVPFVLDGVRSLALAEHDATYAEKVVNALKGNWEEAMFCELRSARPSHKLLATYSNMMEQKASVENAYAERITAELSRRDPVEVHDCVISEGSRVQARMALPVDALPVEHQGQCTGSQASLVATWFVPKTSPLGALVAQSISKECPGLAEGDSKASLRGKGGLLVDAYPFGRSDVHEDADQVPLVEELEWMRVEPYASGDRPDGCSASLDDPVMTKARKPRRRNDGYVIELGK